MNSPTIKTSDNPQIQAFLQAYQNGEISLQKLAELLGLPLEETKHRLRSIDISLNLGITDETELLSDIENS